MPRQERGKIVNRAELASIFGTSLPTIDAWVRAGMPCVQEGGRGVEYRFNTREVIAWRSAREALPGGAGGTGPETLDEAKRRREITNADLAEIELAEKRGQVVPIEHVAKQVGRLLASVKARLLAIPTKAAPVVQTAGSAEEVRATLEDAIREAMTELVSAAAAYMEADQADAAGLDLDTAETGEASESDA